MRKHNYVIGYRGDGNVAYGKEKNIDLLTYAELMTLFQAKRSVKKLVSGKSRGTIYKLVELKE